MSNDYGPWGKPSGGGNNNRPTGGGPVSGGGGGGGPNPDELIKKFQDWFDKHFSGNDGKKKLFGAIGGGAFVLWLLTGFYEVESGVQGIVLRFGQYDRVVGAGPHFHIPAPFESVYLVNTQLVRKESFGGSQSSSYGSDGATTDNLMLTGDENIIDISFDVQWNIKDSRSFLFKVFDPISTVRSASESAMREVIGQTGFTFAQTAGKSKIEQDAKVLIQQTLDTYGAGIRILSVNLLESSAPGPVVEAVRDVQAARADEERSRNEAEAYRNDIIPKARGAAEKMVQEAEAYKQQVVAVAKGDAARFDAVYAQYSKAPEVTRKRIYMETMEKVLGGMNKVIVGKNGAMPYFPLPMQQKVVPIPAEEEKR